LEHQISDVLADILEGTLVGIMVTDPRLEDNPVIYVNESFVKITQYSREYALGRSSAFLNGEKTEAENVEKIRSAMHAGEQVDVILTNHRADGTPFLNHLLIAPVFDQNGHLSAFFQVLRELSHDGDHREVDQRSLDLMRELQHRVKNHLSMVVSLIRMQAKRDVTTDSFTAVARRIEALALLYEEMFAAGQGAGSDNDHIKAGAYLTRIANVIASIDARAGIQVNVNCDETDLPVDQAARLGLLLSELMTNALQHAFAGRKTGVVNIRFTRLSDGGVRLCVEDDGIGLPEGSTWPRKSASVSRQRQSALDEDDALNTTGRRGHAGMGGTIVLSLTEVLDATLNVEGGLSGTIVTVDLATDASSTGQIASPRPVD